MIKTYRAKPVQVVRWTGDNPDDVKLLVGSKRMAIENGNLFLFTHRGNKYVEQGNYIILETETGRIFPLNPMIFNKLYEEWGG